MKTLIIIPAYNEALNIMSVVDNLIQNHPTMDYIVVNDGSTDGTAKILRQNGYKFIDLPINIGLQGAVQTGLKYASINGYDAAVQFDGDGQHNAEYIYELCDAMVRQKSDIVIGSRFVTQKRRRGLRMKGNALLAFLIKLTTGKKMTDPTSGMRMYRKSIIDEFAWNMNYGPEPDTIAYLIKNGANVTEIQVRMNERTAGESYLNFTRSVRYMAHMCISILFIQLFRKRVM